MLIDSYLREITRFRISVISNCNISCSYCHHEGYLTKNEEQKLTIEQITTLVPFISKYKIPSIKITGGEPLLHPDILKIVRILSSPSMVKDLSMTTNAILLEDKAESLKQAGLQRLNVGCDSLKNSAVKTIKRIERSLEKAIEVGFHPIKLNMVLLKGINENEVESMIEYVKNHSLILQIIELIDSDNEYYQRFHVDLTEIEEKMEKRARKIINRNVQNRRQYVLDDDTIVEIVKPMHNSSFCSNCKTMRITNDFQFQSCLNRSNNLVPIEDDLEKALKEAIKRRKPFYEI